MLDRARKRSGGDDRIELRLGDATELDAIPGAFDFIVCTWLLSHLDSPSVLVRDAVARLAPGGTAAFVFFSEPRNPILRALLYALGGPFLYRFVDVEALRSIPQLEHLECSVGGMATIASFRATQPG